MRLLPARALAAVFSSTLSGLAVMATAQDAPARRPLSPEVRAILGDPDATPAPTPDIATILGPPAGPVPNAATASAVAAEIASKLRCPVCQGVAIADSPSGMATNMRAQVRDLVALGYSPEQVMSYFERSFGESVRLEPPMKGLNSVLWTLPALVLIAGAIFIAVRARRTAGASMTPTVGATSSPIATQEDDPELAPYLERVRREAGLI